MGEARKPDTESLHMPCLCVFCLRFLVERDRQGSGTLMMNNDHFGVFWERVCNHAYLRESEAGSSGMTPFFVTYSEKGV